MERCRQARNSTTVAETNGTFTCLEERHFLPKIIETHPYASLAQAALNWLQEHQNECDLVHAHEWGGVFTDLITAVHFRQVILIDSWHWMAKCYTFRHSKELYICRPLLISFMQRCSFFWHVRFDIALVSLLAQ